MKSSEEALVHIVAVISHIYVRPEMYAATPAELYATFFSYHHVWGFISDRQGELLAAHADLSIAEGIGAGHIPDGHYERLKPVDWSRFEPIVDHWRNVDDRIGLDTTNQAAPWPTPPAPLG